MTLEHDNSTGPRHLFGLCSEGAGGGRGQSLPDVDPEDTKAAVRAPY